MRDPTPEEFRRFVDRVADVAAEYLARLDERPIQPAATGAALEQHFAGGPPEVGVGAAIAEAFRPILDGARAQNGRFAGYVMGSGEPIGAAADLLASVVNQNLTAWRSAPAAVAMERAVVRWLAEAVGCCRFGGSLTGGGSAANTMGLAMAREAIAPANERRAFSHTGDYTKSLTQDPVEGFAFFDESLELSRRFRALRLWTSIQYHGMQAFRASIQRDLEHARLLAALVRQHPALELLAPVELSAVCFRHRFAADVDRRNADVLRAVDERGRIYLSNATIRGAFALRACFVNHRTTAADVRAIVDEVVAAGASCERSPPT